MEISDFLGGEPLSDFPVTRPAPFRAMPKRHALQGILTRLKNPHNISISLCPREVFKPAFLCSCTAVIFVHNHPSGAPEPSFDDKTVMGKLYQCGDLLGIDVLDSVIIRNGSYYSFQEKELMDAYRGQRIRVK